MRVAWRFRRVRSILLSLLPRFAALVGCALTVVSAAEKKDAEPGLGFRGPEIYPVDFQASLLLEADLNGDGKLDLVVVNNAKSRIQILWNQTGQTNRPVSVSTRWRHGTARGARRRRDRRRQTRPHRLRP